MNLKSFSKGLLCTVAMAAMASCCNSNSSSGILSQKDFQTEFTGKKTDLYTLTNKNGMEVWVTNFGARIVAIMAPDKNGKLQDCVIGFSNIGDYTTQASDFGSSVGRYANRINQGKITIDGTEYQLPQNNFGHCLHGGCQLEPFPQGWQNLVYTVTKVSKDKITLELQSPDGEAGFPGNVVATCTYTLTEGNAIDIVWNATTDKKTVINMTNHSYFNLNPDHSMPITNHILTLNASNFTPCDATYMTTGEILPVAGTPMDFTTPKAIGQDIEKREYIQLEYGNGYDHNWVLDTKGDDTKCAAKLYSPISGIFVEVYTNEPGIQFYSGNFLDGTGTGKQGQKMEQRTGCCLETQKFPDTPNKSNLPGWPSALLNPGETYYSHCIYQFGVE